MTTRQAMLSLARVTQKTPRWARWKRPEVDVSFVKDYDFSGQDRGAKFLGAIIVVVVGRLNDGESGQKAADVEACRWSLAAALRRRCFAHDMQLATSLMVDESTA
ncbi:MAG: hypothetical protein R3F19_00090 [Verrucomicrobiales bacterium]